MGYGDRETRTVPTFCLSSLLVRILVSVAESGVTRICCNLPNMRAKSIDVAEASAPIEEFLTMVVG